MAINPLLLNVKPISEITTVNNPTEGHLLFYDGSDELKKVDIIEFQSLIGAIALVQADVDDVDTRLETLQGSYSEFASDGVFSIAEAKALEKYINSLNTEKADLSAKYTATNSDANLVDKAPLQTAWSNYDTSHGQLITSINNAISDWKSTPTEKDDVDSKFADYKNKLASLSTAFENALKAIHQAKIDNLQIGGRNLVKQSNKFNAGTGAKGITTSVTAEGYLQVISEIDNENWHTSWAVNTTGIEEQFNDGDAFTITFWVKRISGVGIPTIYIKDGMGYFALWGDLNSTDFKPISYTGVWKKANYISFHLGWGQVQGTFQISKWKIEKGNKATDWTPAPEDVDNRITAEAQKIITLEGKTNFLGSTTIDGNVVATGTMLVGNENGTNAGLTGTGDTNTGVYLWGGGTYQQMVQGLAKKEQRRNGIDIWRHPNGQVGFEIGIKDGRLIFNGYHSDGYKLFELDPNRGLIAVSYTQESWTQTPLRKLNYTSSTFNESTIASEITSAIFNNTEYVQFTAPGEPATIDTDYSYMITYTLLENYVGYEYDNGTNPTNSAYESLKGMKANNGDRNTNIPNGWYLPQLGIIHREITVNSYPEHNYTFTVYVYYYTNGKITDTKVVTITK